MRTRQLVAVALLSALLIIVWTDRLCAQQRELLGTVRDSAGGTLAGVTVELIRDNNVVRSVSTDERGGFRLAVPFQVDASYTIRLTLAGFSPAVVALKPDQDIFNVHAGAFQVQGRFMLYAS